MVLKDKTPGQKELKQLLGKSREKVGRALLPKLEGRLLADVYKCTKGRRERNTAQRIR